VDLIPDDKKEIEMAINYVWRLILFISSLAVGGNEGAINMDIIAPEGEIIEVTVQEVALDNAYEGAHEKIITMDVVNEEIPPITASFVDNALYQITLPGGEEEPFMVDLAPFFVSMEWSNDEVLDQSFSAEGMDITLRNTRRNLYLMVKDGLTFVVSKSK
jgi:hypothetical protein